MSKSEQKPEKVYVENSYRENSYKIVHPAYGCVTMSRPTSSGKNKMFGSDLNHTNTIRLQFSYAVEERGGSTSYVYEKDQILVIEMTEAQWVSFVSNSALGSTTPVTIRRVLEGDLISLPYILEQETEEEKAAQEYKKDMDLTVEKGKILITKLKELLEKGKANKKELSELLNITEQSLGRFVSDTTFSVEMFEKALEKIKTQAKIEIETHILLTTQKIGAESLGINLNGTFLENKQGD